MTPEGKVKAAVKKVLAKYGEELYAFWPVQNGMGSPTLDCIVCYRGKYIAIETKAPGKLPTPRQLITISKMEKAGAKVFVIDGSESCVGLDEYLRSIVATLYTSHMNPEGPRSKVLVACDAEPGRNYIHSRF